jgi:hypothetical protein
MNYGKNPTTSKFFWKRIKCINENKDTQKDIYPNLDYEGKSYKTDGEKANIFAEMLSKNFKDDKINNFYQKFKEKIDIEIDKMKTESVEYDKINTDCISVKNLNLFLKSIKSSLVNHISRAFDKIWHNDLISKLVLFKFDMNIIKWIMNFITNRFFKIKINNIFSPENSIETGVSQGRVLSLTLFSIYINDNIIFENTNKITD